MSIKEKIINYIIDIEGGYVNDPKDSGGETKYGITHKVALAYGYHGKMIDLPRELAFEIYQAKYWDSVKGDEILKLSPSLAEEVVDTAINLGSVRASIFLQRVISVLSPDNIAIDGVIGAITLHRLRVLTSRRGESVILKALNSLQGAFYIRLAERRPKDKRFVYGWLNNRVSL